MHNKIVVFFALLLCSSVFARNSPMRVLSIDGGGVRGIIAATVLQEIEEELQRPISQIFDFVAGTSTGGLIAISLATKDTLGNPLRTASEIVDSYMRHSSLIFSASFGHRLANLGGLLGPKYDSSGLCTLLCDNLGDRKLSDATIPLLITAYHVAGETGVEFFSETAKAYKTEKDCLMREVAMATAAAPTYFEPADVNFTWGKLESVVDGGIYKMNPSLLAYVNAHALDKTRPIEIYSIGTGISTAEELSSEIKGRGLLRWVSPIITHFQLGGSEADDAILHRLLNEDGEENYFRLNVRINRKHASMDDTTQENLTYLRDKGKEITKTSTFARMIDKLKNKYDQ